MEEIWKDIEGFEGLYQVSNLGRIKSVFRVVEHKPYNLTIKEKIRKQRLDRKGYYYFMASKNGVISNLQVHRLVALAFIPNPLSKIEVNHINGIKTDNRVNNLEWATHQENMRHAWDNDLISKEGKERFANGRKDYLKKIRKPIKQIKNGVVVNVYSSILEASNKTGFKTQNIIATLQKKYGRKSCGGFEWEYCD